MFITDTPNGSVVCKFNDANMISRNHQVSSLLSMANIPVPQTQTHAFLDAHFESYVYYPEKTLYEHMQSGLTDKQIFQTYTQAIQAQKSIAEIKPNDLHLKYGKYAYETFKANQKMILPNSLTNIYGYIYKLVAGHGQMRLLHNDIYSKNMLVDNDINLVRLIDLDMIALSNVNFSVIQLLRNYPLKNHKELIEYYADTLSVKLNPSLIITGVKIMDSMHKYKMQLSRMYWRGYQKMFEK